MKSSSKINEGRCQPVKLKDTREQAVVFSWAITYRQTISAADGAVSTSTVPIAIFVAVYKLLKPVESC